MPDETAVPEQRRWEISAEAAEKAALLTIPRFDSAIAEGRVGLPDLMFAERDLDAEDEVVRAVAQRYYPQLLSAFEGRHGAVTRRYEARVPELSAVLTEGGTLDVQTNSGTIGFEWASASDLTLDAEDLRDRIVRILDTREAYGYLEMIFNVLTHVLGTLERTHVRVGSEGDDTAALVAFEQDVARYSARLRGVEAKFLAAAARVALTRYFRGVVLGAAGLALVVGLVGAASLELDFSGVYVATLLAGGLGAILSVMSRVARDQVTVDREAPQRVLTLLGAVRPFVGAIFGLAVVVLVLGEVLPAVKAPDDPETEIYFLAGLAFLAGFSERFAQDVVVSSTSTFSPPPAAPEGSAPAAPQRGTPTT